MIPEALGGFSPLGMFWKWVSLILLEGLFKHWECLGSSWASPASAVVKSLLTSTPTTHGASVRWPLVLESPAPVRAEGKSSYAWHGGPPSGRIHSLSSQEKGSYVTSTALIRTSGHKQFRSSSWP
jgi:hypothetical protein